MWSYDIIRDRTVTGKTLRMLVVLDDYTRECLGILVQERLNSEIVVDALAGIVRRLGKRLCGKLQPAWTSLRGQVNRWKFK